MTRRGRDVPGSGVEEIEESLVGVPWIFFSITGADLGGWYRGCASPPPWDELRLSNTTGILQKNYVVYCHSLEVHPVLKKKSWIRPCIGLIHDKRVINCDYSSPSISNSYMPCLGGNDKRKPLIKRTSRWLWSLKAGLNMKAVFWLGMTFLTQISHWRFKQWRISLLISHIYVLGRFVNFLVIFRYIWR